MPEVTAVTAVAAAESTIIKAVARSRSRSS